MLNRVLRCATPAIRMAWRSPGGEKIRYARHAIQQMRIGICNAHVNRRSMADRGDHDEAFLFHVFEHDHGYAS